MSAVRFIVAGVALILCSSAVLAFQEQRSGTSAPAAAATEQAAKPDAALASPDAAQSGKSGTEVRIPGLGKLGELPKMDFGLELLYGAADGKQAEPPQRDDNREDLTIRGSIKRKF